MMSGNYKYQKVIQVNLGDDVAKWVEITGTRLFLYDAPDYSGTPTPSSVVLYCNTYGMTNPTYEWRLLNRADRNNWQ